MHMHTCTCTLAHAQMQSLEEKLGRALIEKKFKPLDLIKSWDSKLRGCINKIEFRQGVRALGIKVRGMPVRHLGTGCTPPMNAPVALIGL